MHRLGVVTGLKSEARLAQNVARQAGADVLVRCDGPGPVQARIAAKALAAEGVAGLVSFGLAGALVAGLTPGTILLPQNIMSANGVTLAVDAGLHARALAALGSQSVRTEALYGGTHVVATPAEKSALAQTSRAVAVDMESAGVAEIARDLGLPFLVMRAVADPADRAIPAEAQAGMGEDGGVNAFAVLAELARRPLVVPEIVQLARDTATANAALGRAARLLFLALGVGR